MFSVTRLFRSIRYALRGLDYAVRHERNFQLEIFLACVAGVSAIVFRISRTEWLVVIFLIFWVLSFELANTAVERIINVLKPTLHPYARVIKDIMAGAVLMAAIAAAVIGFAIFFPRVLSVIMG